MIESPIRELARRSFNAARIWNCDRNLYNTADEWLKYIEGEMAILENEYKQKEEIARGEGFQVGVIDGKKK